MEGIKQDSLLYAIENEITKVKEEKVKLLSIDKNHPSLEKVNARANSLVLIKSELIRENKNNKEYHLTKEEEIILLNNMAEKRKQNVKDYSRNGRPESAEADYQEQLIIEEFLPKMPSEKEIKEFIANTIDSYAAEQGITQLSMKDMGKIKNLVNATYPTINGGIIKEILMAKING